MAMVHSLGEQVQSSVDTADRLVVARQGYNRAADRARFKVFGRHLLGGRALRAAKAEYHDAFREHVTAVVPPDANGEAFEMMRQEAIQEHVAQWGERRSVWHPDDTSVYQRKSRPEKRFSAEYVDYRLGNARESLKDAAGKTRLSLKLLGVKEPEWYKGYDLRPDSFVFMRPPQEPRFSAQRVLQPISEKASQFAERARNKRAELAGVVGGLAAASVVAVLFAQSFSEEKNTNKVSQPTDKLEQVASFSKNVQSGLNLAVANVQNEARAQVAAKNLDRTVETRVANTKRPVTNAPEGFWAQQYRATGTYEVYASRNHAGLWQISETAAEHRADRQVSDAVIAQIVRDIREARLKKDIVSDELDFKERVVVPGDSIDSALATER